MELLFWNMGKNDNAALALECMCSNGVSVAAFAKYSGTEFSDELLRGTGYRVLGFGGCDKVQGLLIALLTSSTASRSRDLLFSPWCVQGLGLCLPQRILSTGCHRRVLSLGWRTYDK